MTLFKLILVPLMTAMLMPLQALAVGSIAVGDQDARAIDASTELYFVSTGHDSAEAAKSAAVKQCELSGAKFCHAGAWYSNCGAYAKSENQSSLASGPTQEEAGKLALKNCGKDCVLVVAQCEPS